MMASLRARLLAAVLALTAVRPAARSAAITYVEQRSFLLDRVDQQLRAAIAGRRRTRLDQGRAARPGDYGGPRRTTGAAAAARTSASRPAPTASSATPPAAVLAAKPFALDRHRDGQARRCRRSVPIGEPFTVDGQKGAGTRYRALGRRDPMDGGTTVAAIPLRDIDQTLHGCCSSRRS